MNFFYRPKINGHGIVKTCSIQTAIALMLFTLAFSHDNRAQVLEQRVTLDLRDVAIEEVLDAIERSTKVKFFYSADQLNVSKKITVQVIERTLREVLDEVLSPYQIKYRLHEEKRTITLKREDDRKKKEKAVTQTSGKDRLLSVGTVTGTVVDAATQMPMAGVNIIIKGTTVGTSTDSEGNYSIIVNDNDVLIFSFIGYASYETEVNGRSVIDVMLEVDTKSLQAVEINAGYYLTTNELQTSSIAKISPKDIQSQPVSNPLAALQGRVPGLEITQTTGVPGGNFRVRIRGTNSIGNGNDPLYIIDGVPYTSTSMAFNITSNALLANGTSPLNNINPNDIESIEILKDAGATAIYGSRGANGVILITTKKGKSGDEKIDFTFYQGVGKVTSKMDLLSSDEYLEMRRQAIISDGYQAYLDNPAFDFIWPDVKDWDPDRYTDWQEELIGGTARTTDAQVSASGGNNDLQYYIGGSWHQETTVFPGDNTDRRIATHFNLSNTSHNEKMKTSLSFNYSMSNSDMIKQDLTLLALTLPPNGPALYNDRGELNWEPDTWTAYFPNPLAFLETNYESSTKNLVANFVVNYSILKNLQAKASVGYTDIDMNAVTMTPVSYYFPGVRSQYKNESNFGENNFRNWIVEPQLNWSPAIGRSTFDFLIGASFLDQTSEGLAQFADGFSNEALMKNIGAASNIYLSESNFSQYRYHAVFGRINFTHKEKYVVNITGRRDGSSRFGPGKQFANFGAVGAAWIFSKEELFKPASTILSFGKIRASYGVTGNDQIGDYQYLDAYTTSLPYQGTASLAPVRLSNPEFSWERNKKAEIGMDLGFFHDRVYASMSYYRNRSDNQLVGFALPPTTGFQSIQGNFPAIVENTGVEAQISSINMEKENLSWTSSLNFTKPRNKLVEFPDLEESPQYANRLVVGEPLSIRKTFRYLGVDPETGLYQIEDTNDDGIINVKDKQIVKFVGPDFFGGLQNNFQFKGFELSVFFQFVKQTGYNYMFSGWSVPGSQANQPRLVTNRWQNSGDITSIQKYTTADPGATLYTHMTQSEQSVGDASFIRLKNLSISYAFPQTMIEKLQLQKARVFVLGQNLMTITNYNGMDPENQNVNASLPPLRIFTVGCQVTL